MLYDYLIIGSGLFGSVFAREMTDIGKKCLILEKRKHLGGNIFTEKKDEIIVHKYGAHIFHTSNKKIWDYVNKYCEFNSYVHKLYTKYKNKVYSFPINLMTFQQVYGINTPSEAEIFLQSKKIKIENPKNFEEYALSQIGEDFYEMFIKYYTIKQWQMDPKNLPSEIFKRIPIRLNYDSRYYFDEYQGIPINGYTELIINLQKNIPVILNCDYFDNKLYWDTQAKKILYTGPIDKFYDFKYGNLEYRTNDFTFETLDMNDYQGVSVMNYTDESVPYTRVFEYKHFIKSNYNHTVISKDYPQKWFVNSEPYYPINNSNNMSIYYKYKDLNIHNPKFLFGGRLAEYRYYDMHQIVASALYLFEKETDIKII